MSGESGLVLDVAGGGGCSGPNEPPARTTVEVRSFPGGMAVEIDAITYIPK